MYYSLFVCNGKWDYFFASLSDFSLLVYRNTAYLFFKRAEKEKKQKRNKQLFPCSVSTICKSLQAGWVTWSSWERKNPCLAHTALSRWRLPSSAGCHNKMPKTGWFKQQELISHSSGVWKSKVKVKADSVAPEAFLFGLQMAVLSYVLMWSFPHMHPGVSFSSIKTLSYWSWVPILTGLFFLPNNSFEGATSKYSHILRYRRLEHQHTKFGWLGRVIQLIIGILGERIKNILKPFFS